MLGEMFKYFKRWCSYPEWLNAQSLIKQQNTTNLKHIQQNKHLFPTQENKKKKKANNKPKKTIINKWNKDISKHMIG